MAVWFHQLPGFQHYRHPSLSFPIFIKHLTTSPRNPKTSLTAAASHLSPRLETLNPHQKEQISLYVDALLQWNQKMNLTSEREASEVMKRHVEDSLAIIPPIRTSYLSRCGDSCDSINLVDVGTGPGLPGLILAIACPGWKLTLLESMHKRCVFLEHAVGLTGLSNVQVLRSRAELVGQKHEFREVFDVAVARAVAEMRVLAEYCLPLVRVGGLFVAAKGYDPQIHTKRRNRLEQKRLNDLVYVCYNQILHHRYQKRDNIDPISLKDINESNEWLTGMMGSLDLDEGGDDTSAPDLVFPGEDLDWAVVTEAMGVDEPRARTRAKGKSLASTSTGSVYQRRGRARLAQVEEEEEEDDDEEEEEEFVAANDTDSNDYLTEEATYDIDSE